MTAAAITASASIVVAVLVFVLNQRAQLRLERRKARLDRIGDQLARLYGPLHALVDVNEDLWTKLHEAFLPGQTQRRSATAPTDEQLAEWRTWLDHALMPANRRMRDLIIEHADLLVEAEIPVPLREFCTHVAAHEVMLSTDDPHLRRSVFIRHPGAPYLEYVRRSFADLKAEQARLLKRDSPP